ncbi:DNA translocase FtsK 4TM domain-containing protein [Candidatus Saccharibacteria bacterium]|nr:DNA translocase FtsK 4TM domain-containing protein [Candidatus Saccharibacteria bacterium]
MANTKKKSSRGGRSSGRGGSRGRSGSKRSTREVRKKQELPGGWGQQVLALILIAISVIVVATWFSGEQSRAYKIVFSIIGNGMYVIPFLFTYLAVKIFRSDDNRLPTIVWIVSILLIAFAAGASGVLSYGNKSGIAHGGAVGEWINELVVPMFGDSTAVFVYVVLILVCLLFILQKTPSAVVKGLKSSLKGKEKDVAPEMKEDNIEEIEDDKKRRLEFRVNKGVAVEEKKEEEAPVKKRGLFGRGKIEEVETPVKPEAKIEKPAGALTSVADKNWKFPPIDLLEKKQSPADAGNIQQNAVIIKSTLAEFGIDVEMEGANIGPRVTQYTMRPPAGVNLSKILARDKELALNLAVDKIRIEAPIPGTRSVGVEIPNVKSASVMMRGIIDSREWKNAKEPLTFAVGKDISGKNVVANLAKMPHLLIAGTTGSGKSVMTNTLISSLLYRNSPSDLKLIIVDPKQVEMAQYEDIPHLLTPIITSVEKTMSAMKWAVNEMEKRYSLMAEKKVKNIADYNARIEAGEDEVKVEDGKIEEAEQKPQEGKMPYIVVVIDEMADLMMMAGKDLEMLIVRIAQKGRAAGIHLVLATQRPEVKVITGLIKANIPGRIAFAVGSQIDSRIMLDQGGAEKLLGKGDMLMLTTEMMGKPRRIQGAWAYEDERGNGDVKKLTDFLRAQRAPEYNPEVVAQPVQIKGLGPTDGGAFGDLGRKYDPNDPVVRKAVEISISKGKFSTAMLQTYLGKGHGFVSGLAIWFEEIGVIGPQNGNKPRDMLIKSLEEFDQLASN